MIKIEKLKARQGAELWIFDNGYLISKQHSGTHYCNNYGDFELFDKKKYTIETFEIQIQHSGSNAKAKKLYKRIIADLKLQGNEHNILAWLSVVDFIRVVNYILEE